MADIPRIIHYCWFGGSPLPRMARRCIRSWKRYCPGWEIRLWDESNTDLDSHPYIREALAAGKYAFVTDVVRLRVLYEYGGVYLDTDVELIRPIEDLLTGEGYVGLEPGRDGRFYVNTGSGIACVPGQRAVEALLRDYESVHFLREDGTMDTTACTQRNSGLLERYGLRTDDSLQTVLGLTVLPSDYLCPKNVYTGALRITERTYSIHHYSMSWLTPAQRRRYIYRRFMIALKRYAFGRYLVRVKHALFDRR